MADISNDFKAELEKYTNGIILIKKTVAQLQYKANSEMMEDNYLLGRAYLSIGDNGNDNNIGIAFNLMIKAVRMGHKKAKFYMFEFPENIREAHEFEENELTCAREGYARSQYIVGNYHFEGRDSYEKNQKKAMTYWRCAAKQAMTMAKEGISPAQLLLAEMYLEGKGVPQSYKHAFTWAEIADINGQLKASEISNKATNKMTKEEIMHAKIKVADMLEENCELYEIF